VIERLVVATPPPSTTAVPVPVEVPDAEIAEEKVEAGPAPEGTLAFAMRHNGNSDIYLLSQGAGRPLRLTFSPADDRDPAWSPDGRYLAFASRRSDTWELYAMEMTSGTILRLTHSAAFKGSPSWSPDGRWLAHEMTTDGALNIHVLNFETGESQQLTFDAAPQYSPAWSPDGRHIAFTAYHDQDQDIFVLSLDTGAAANLTKTPDQNEDYPAWSPDGTMIAYSAGAPGGETIWMLPFDPAALAGGAAEAGTSDGLETFAEVRPILYGIGGQPAWSPDGQSLAFVARREGTSYLVAADRRGWGLTREEYSSTETIYGPQWRADGLRPELASHLERQGQAAGAPLYTELLLTQASGGDGVAGRTQLVALPNVNGSHQAERLSDRVNDSYNALRERIKAETGWDYLAVLGDSWRPMDHTPRPGQGRISWHVCGRAVDINQGFLRTGDVELVREDVGGVTYWRVFIRARTQDGTLGEPLRVAPWDLNARARGGLATLQGGELKAIPPGYYVDFTTIALDYGWERRNALSGWRSSYYDIEWWHFQKTDGLSWYACMLELYTEEAVIESYEALPWWTKHPEWELRALP
jgi:TolB protein